MFCRKCGTQNVDGSVFCSNCGERLDNVAEEILDVPAQSEVVETITQPEEVQPVEPVVPVEPIQQTQPVEPSQPIEPIQPVQSSQLVEPVQPVESVAPAVQPDIVQPVAPVQPVINQTPINNVVDSSNNKSKGGKIGLIIGLIAIVLVIGTLVVLFATGLLNFNNIFKGKSNSTPTPAANEEKKPAEETNKYEIGDAVTTVDGSEWHVIGVDKNNVTLLLDKLVVDETGFGPSSAEADQKYENSTVKKYIDNTYMPELTSKIDAAGGDSSKIVGRLITIEEYLDLTKTQFNEHYTNTIQDYSIFDKANYKELLDKSCEMKKIMAMTKSFWTSSNLKDYDPSNNYYGAFYVYLREDYEDTVCNYNKTVYAWTDFAASGRAGYGATLVGIRPVIETPISNIK